MPAENRSMGARTVSWLPNAAGQILDLQESLDRDLGSLVNIVATIGERMSDSCHCRTNPKVTPR